LNELGVANEMSNLGQAAQVETTLSNLENMDFRSDLEAANQRLMDEIDHLRVARHAWRDHQESTFLRLARIENSVNKIEKQLQSDPTTGLPNRIGLEMALDAWWQDGRHQQQSLAAVLLNVDALGKLNRQQGALAGDSLLYQLGRHLRATAAADDLVGRAAGGSFLVVVPQSGRDAACKTAELLRHSIAQIRFKQGEETLQITVSAGVTEVRPEEPDRELMFARLAQSLKTAKQSGHNRSFFHDGTEPHLIETPPPAVESLEIAL
jgi:diguanylate cyclase (GGDEF)-like protein